MRAHGEVDDDIIVSSDGESAEDHNTNNAADSTPCAVCAKPKWCKSYNVTKMHCRDYCTHFGENHSVEHDDAPTMERAKVMPLLSALLMPPEVEEIAEKNKRPWSKKKLKALSKSPKKSETTSLPAAAATGEHREKLEPFGDQLNPLIAWYSLVAKPIPRKMWATMPRAKAAIDAEWQKLRDCDGGKGT